MDAASAKAFRSTAGCWTCKLRRKKCDERHPTCKACTLLEITCHYGPDRPQWLDGGVKQGNMLLSVKREVRQNAPYRLVKRKNEVAPTLPAVNHTEPAATKRTATSPAHRPATCRLAYKDAGAEEGFEQSDTMLLMFYLEHVFPSLFPFYRPLPNDGGKEQCRQQVSIRECCQPSGQRAPAGEFRTSCLSILRRSLTVRRHYRKHGYPSRTEAA